MSLLPSGSVSSATALRPGLYGRRELVDPLVATVPQGVVVEMGSPESAAGVVW